MAWETIAQIYRAQGIPHGTTYWDIDTDTTELNDDFTKYITIQFNGQTLYVTKSAVYDFESYGGAIILVVKDTTNSGYIRERLIHSQSSYNYTTLLTPNYTENGLKVYIKSLSPEHLPNVQIPVTSNVGGTPMTSNISIFSDRITRVYTYQDYMALMELPKITSNGGGATHIAKVTGQLKDLSSNLSDILMVSGGGGGGLLVGDTDYSGKEAGGISGNGDNSANQSTGNAFGQGESGTNVSGGGSGLYGGYKGTSAKSGGAGSGYIGNSLVSNKKMVGYNVPTSSAEGTKTESVEVYDSNYVANKPKAGNGHARIKFLRDILIRVLVDSSTEYLDSNLTETRMVEQGPGYTKGGGGGFSQGLFGIGSNYGAQVGFGYVTDLIDFSLYSKIKLIDFRYTSANNNSFKIALVRDEPIWKIQNQSPWASLNKITDFTATNKSSSQDYVFDISSITESGYLIFGCPNMEIENSFSVEFQKLELIE